MIDVDMVKLLPQAFEDFQKSFKLPGILPGGSHCMMNAVSSFLVGISRFMLYFHLTSSPCHNLRSMQMVGHSWAQIYTSHHLPHLHSSTRMEEYGNFYDLPFFLLVTNANFNIACHVILHKLGNCGFWSFMSLWLQ